ncbi:MAG: hypothetical protein KKG99_02175 [Bacteroidetes bacterium]|nr:hypothetical protein [Bacteroidota bacterium]
MKKIGRYLVILYAIIHFYQMNVFGQQTDLTHRDIFPKGISFDYGIGNYSVQDDFFSGEKYSGSLPYIKLGWSRFHDKRAFQLYLEYRSSDEIKSGTFSASVTQFSLESNYLYPIGSFQLFSKKVYAYLGPYSEFYFYYNKQNFANDGLFFDFTFASLISIGVQPMLIMPIDKRLQVESSLQINILSVSMRMIEVEDLNDGSEEESPLKLVTPFGGLNTQWNLGIRYYPFKFLSLKLRYEAEITRTTHQRYMISASDNLVFGISFHLNK